MILGLGSDLVDVRRIEATLARFGDRFTHRIFTPGERARCDRRAARAEVTKIASVQKTCGIDPKVLARMIHDGSSRNRVVASETDMRGLEVPKRT